MDGTGREICTVASSGPRRGPDESRWEEGQFSPVTEGRGTLASPGTFSEHACAKRPVQSGPLMMGVVHRIFSTRKSDTKNGGRFPCLPGPPKFACSYLFTFNHPLTNRGIFSARRAMVSFLHHIFAGAGPMKTRTNADDLPPAV